MDYDELGLSDGDDEPKKEKPKKKKAEGKKAGGGAPGRSAKPVASSGRGLPPRGGAGASLGLKDPLAIDFGDDALPYRLSRS